jgi:NTP pyrophosphatase (non-canonical NTP hydrolase)
MVGDMNSLEYDVWVGSRALGKMANKTSTKAGWYSDPETGEPVDRNFGEVIALMHTELSEALESDRKGLKDEHLPDRDGREVEFADLMLRVMDTAHALGLDVAGAIIDKNRFNGIRADHKLESRRAGGKKY